MRKLLLLLTVLLVAFIVTYRQRLFLRDPLGKVFVNGTELPNATLFINFSNDVLARIDNTEVLVQNADRQPGTPTSLTCFHHLACLTPADPAPKTPLPVSPATMSDRLVTYLDPSGKTILIVIR